GGEGEDLGGIAARLRDELEDGRIAAGQGGAAVEEDRARRRGALQRLAAAHGGAALRRTGDPRRGGEGGGEGEGEGRGGGEGGGDAGRSREEPGGQGRGDRDRDEEDRGDLRWRPDGAGREGALRHLQAALEAAGGAGGGDLEGRAFRRGGTGDHELAGEALRVLLAPDRPLVDHGGAHQPPVRREARPGRHIEARA